MKILKTSFVTLVILIATLFTLQLSVHCIPTKYLLNNIKESAQIIQKEGLYPNILNFKLFQLDNYTDVLMLNLAASANSTRPLESAMLNYYYESDDFFDLAKNTEDVAKGETINLEKVSYARYWQGHQVFLRPLLTIMNYKGIRIMNYILLFCLALFSFYLIKKNISLFVAVIFALSLLLINFPIVPLSIQFSTVFYITFISIIFILIKKKQILQKNIIIPTFIVIGGCTSFFDFLTAPLITLGLPVTIYLLLFSGKNKTIKLATASFAWGLGYAITWSSKWFIAQQITGTNILADAASATALRTSNLYKGMEMTLPNIIDFIWQKLNSMHLLWIVWSVLSILVIMCIIYCVLMKDKKIVTQNMFLLLISLYAPIWFLILRNHSIQHGWFTWRALLVSLFSFIIFIYNTISLKKIKLPTPNFKKNEKNSYTNTLLQ